MPVSKRMSAAESAKYEGLDVHVCAACKTVYQRDQVPDHFALDNRTSDGFSRLCLDCLLLRDKATARRGNETKAAYMTRQRAEIRTTRLRAAQAGLADQLPDHGVPSLSFEGYPPTPTPDQSRTPARAARLTWLYGMLRDFDFPTWEKVSEETRTSLRQKIGFGVVSLDVIDEHLKALDLPPLKP